MAMKTTPRAAMSNRLTPITQRPTSLDISAVSSWSLSFDVAAR
jgi:hypothetical protein